MIKYFTPQPYDGLNTLPNYVKNVQVFILTATVKDRYEITLGKLTVGESTSAGIPLGHALFESFSDHGVRMKTARTRVTGPDKEFVAAKSAMTATGVEFHPALPNSYETILYSLGEWFQAKNSDIQGLSVVSQNCH